MSRTLSTMFSPSVVSRTSSVLTSSTNRELASESRSKKTFPHRVRLNSRGLPKHGVRTLVAKTLIARETRARSRAQLHRELFMPIVEQPQLKESHEQQFQKLLDKLQNNLQGGRTNNLLNVDEVALIETFDELLQVAKLVTQNGRDSIFHVKQDLIKISSAGQLISCIHIWPDLAQEFLFSQKWMSEPACYGVDLIKTTGVLWQVMCLLSQSSNTRELMPDVFFGAGKIDLVFDNLNARDADLDFAFYEMIFQNPKEMLAVVQKLPNFAEKILFGRGSTGMRWLSPEGRNALLGIPSLPQLVRDTVAATVQPEQTAGTIEVNAAEIFRP